MNRAMPAVSPSGGAFKYMELGGLPDSFILAVTATHVYALEDKRNGGQLVAGKVLKTWDRGLRARVEPAQLQRIQGVPDDRQLLILYMPVEGGGNRYLEAAVRNLPDLPGMGFPRKFMVARDAPSWRVIDALVSRNAGPTMMRGGVVVAGGIAGGTPVAPPQPSVPERLQQLETLRTTGAISDAEYTAKRTQIINEI